MSEKLIITIKKDGTIEAQTQEIKGKKCEDYVRIIEELTNSKAIKKEYTQEYYEEEEKIMDKELEKQLKF